MIDFNALRGGNAIFPTLDTSTSALDTWHRCDRRYMYRYVRGLVPIGTSEAMMWGTLFHTAAQEYYRGLKNHAREDTALHNALFEIERRTVVESKWHGDTTITLDDQKREQLADTFKFYYENIASKDDWDEIVAVEESIFLIIGYGGQPVLRIRCTLDLLAKKMNRLCIVDHKTTGDVEKSLDFLALDMQTRLYPLAVKTMYEDADPAFCYNMVAREVPPGYGHRSELTDTGKKRSADTLANMQRKERYLNRQWLTFSEAQYNAFQMSLVQDALSLQFEGTSGIWPRKVVKMGGMACDSCPYFALCTAELDGRKIEDDSAVITMAFMRDPLMEPKAKSKIVLPGMPENPFA
jgi:hypothetical protein